MKWLLITFVALFGYVTETGNSLSRYHWGCTINFDGNANYQSTETSKPWDIFIVSHLSFCVAPNQTDCWTDSQKTANEPDVYSAVCVRQLKLKAKCLCPPHFSSSCYQLGNLAKFQHFVWRTKVNATFTTEPPCVPVKHLNGRDGKTRVVLTYKRSVGSKRRREGVDWFRLNSFSSGLSRASFSVLKGDRIF